MRPLLALVYLVFVPSILFSQDAGLKLTYSIKTQSFVIDGFDDKNPYYLEDGKKVFPEARGVWSVTGDFESLKRTGYSPNNFSLIKRTKSYKQRNFQDAYVFTWERNEAFPTEDKRDKSNSYLYWDTSNLKDVIVVGAWIGTHMAQANVRFLEGGDIKNLTTEKLSKLTLRTSNMRGYPVVWLLDAETLQLIPPNKSAENSKAYLNWLMKTGTDEAFIQAWNTKSARTTFEDGEINPLHLMAVYRRESILASLPELENLATRTDKFKRSPGHWAARIGNMDFMNALENPKSADVADWEGNFPFHYAIITGHVDLFKWWVDQFELQNKKVHNKPDTPTLLALNNHRHEIFDYLTSLKTRPGKFEKTSLNSMFHSICLFGRTNFVEYLLRFDPDLRNPSNGKDAVEAAIRSGNPEVLKLLLERIKKPGYWVEDSQTTYLHTTALFDEAEMVSLLIEKGIPVNATTTQQVTPLYLAVTSDNLATALKLIEHGANPDIFPPDGIAAIWAATYRGNREGIQMLLAAGATCELTPDFANTLVEYATLYDIPEVVQISLDQCLPADYQLYEEFPGIYIADYFGSEGVKKLLEEKGQSLDSIKKPEFASAGDLDNPLKFLRRPKPPYPESMGKKYGTLETKVTVIFNKAGQLILPRFDPALPPDLNRSVREIFKSWLIEPPISGGREVNVLATFPFKLEYVPPIAQIYEISTLDVPAKLLKTIAPLYPREMKDQGVQSTVEVVFVVMEDGSVSDIKITKMGSPAFGKAAVEAIKQWKFEPGIKDGKPVQSYVRLPLSFTLRR